LMGELNRETSHTGFSHLRGDGHHGIAGRGLCCAFAHGPG
jgi:hypothetical protein